MARGDLYLLVHVGGEVEDEYLEDENDGLVVGSNTLTPADILAETLVDLGVDIETAVQAQITAWTRVVDVDEFSILEGWSKAKTYVRKPAVFSGERLL